MRFLVIEASPRFGGGSEAMALEVTRQLARRGHDMLLAYETADTMLPAYREVTVRQWQSSLPPFGWRNLLGSLSLVARLARYCRDEHVDAIFTTHLGYLRSLALVEKFYDIPTVYHLGINLGSTSRGQRWAMRRLFAGIAPSVHTARLWQSHGWPATRLHVVPNWIDTERFVPCSDRAALRRTLQLDEHASLVVYVGRITALKGIGTLLRAMARVIQHIPTAKLVLAGIVDPGYRTEFETIISDAGLTPDQLLRVGATDHPEQYQSVADVVVVPSEWEEPFGLVLVEAMSTAALTLASNVGVLPQIVGDENRDLVFPAGDAAALATGIIHWLQRPADARARGQRLRQRAIAAYGGRSSVDRYEQLLVEAAEKHAKPGD